MKKNWLHIFLAALLLCLLLAAFPAMAAETTGETAVVECTSCGKYTTFTILKYIPSSPSGGSTPNVHWTTGRCQSCGNEKDFVLGDGRESHTGGTETPTCTTGKTCVKCGAEYGIEGHEWGAWVSNGDNKTHTRTCQKDPSHIETANCSGDSTATCVVLGTCTECGGQCYGEHTFPKTWDWSSNPYVERDAEKHWVRCMNDGCVDGRKDETDHRFVPGNMYLKSAATCVSKPEYYVNCGSCYYQGTETYFYEYGTINPNNHDIKQYAAKAPTCTEVGWDAYEACQREGCGYSTYAEIPASGHSLTHHAGKAATCTEPGWAAYDTCSKCSYSTYQALPALRHDLIHHEAQAATCTEIGWEAYDTCSRCDYTTYVELPALGHDYKAEIIPRTCEDDGYTLHTCTRCADSYTDTIIPHCGHWYGEWTANGDGTQRAECLRGGCHYEKTVACESVELPALNLSLCPVCGTMSDGSKLALTSASVKIISGRIPHGEALLRVGTLANGEKLLTVGYVYGGTLSKASCQVKITLPADLVNGCTLSLLNADGTETPVDCTVDGDSAVFTLTFAQPLLAVRLVPAP